MKRKALIVDDSRDCVTILGAMLAAQGFEIDKAHSGHEALEKLNGELPDVMLLDVMMPDMTGFEVLKVIRENHPTSKLPVIMVSARTEDDDLMVGYQNGADYYITKPCTAQQVMYGIQLVLQKADTAGGQASQGREASGGTA